MESSAAPSSDIPVMFFCKHLNSFINIQIVQKLQTQTGALAEPRLKRGQHFPMDVNARLFRGEGLRSLEDPAVDGAALDPGIGLAGLDECVGGALRQGALQLGPCENFLCSFAAGLLEMLDIDGHHAAFSAVVKGLVGFFASAVSVGDRDHSLVEVVIDLPEPGSCRVLTANALLTFDSAAFNMLE